MNLRARLGKTLIIVNPAAQSGEAAVAAKRLQRFLALCSHDADGFDIAHTAGPRHATKLAAEAGRYETVLALGGDGVIHEVANGLMRIARDKRPMLGVIPVGSGNDFARTLGITDVSGTDFSPLLASEPVSIDLLKISYTCPKSHRENIEYALETVSFGLDAAIAIDTHDMRKLTGLAGTPLYMASGLKAFGRGYRDFPVRVRIDESAEFELRAIIFAIQNGPTYGSGFHICPDAIPTDGLMDLCFAKGPVSRAVALPVFLSAKNGGHVGHKRMHLQRARRVELSFAESGYPIQADGEQIDADALIIEVMPGELTVLRPR